jgi:predicted nuclease with TOPRIM domain
MPDEPENLILLREIRHEQREIRGDIAAIRADISEIRERLGLLEVAYASLSRRVDRMGGELETLNRRFDVVEATR